MKNNRFLSKAEQLIEMSGQRSGDGNGNENEVVIEIVIEARDGEIEIQVHEMKMSYGSDVPEVKWQVQCQVKWQVRAR